MADIKKTDKKRLFYDFYNPPDSKAVDIGDHFQKRWHLDYDDHGKVQYVDDGDFDFWQFVQADADSSCLKNQLRNLALQGVTAPGTSYMDISEMPDDSRLSFEEYVSSAKSNAEKAAKRIGISEDELKKVITLSEDDLNKLISEKVQALIDKNVSTAKSETETGNEVK